MHGTINIKSANYFYQIRFLFEENNRIITEYVNFDW